MIFWNFRFLIGKLFFFENSVENPGFFRKSGWAAGRVIFLLEKTQFDFFPIRKWAPAVGHRMLIFLLEKNEIAFFPIRKLASRAGSGWAASRVIFLLENTQIVFFPIRKWARARARIHPARARARAGWMRARARAHFLIGKKTICVFSNKKMTRLAAHPEPALEANFLIGKNAISFFSNKKMSIRWPTAGAHFLIGKKSNCVFSNKKMTRPAAHPDFRKNPGFSTEFSKKNNFPIRNRKFQKITIISA